MEKSTQTHKKSCSDQLGVPITVGDKIIYSLSEKQSQIYTGQIIDIKLKTYNNYSSYEVKILTDKTKREITRNPKNIIGIQPIIKTHPEYFI